MESVITILYLNISALTSGYLEVVAFMKFLREISGDISVSDYNTLETDL